MVSVTSSEGLLVTIKFTTVNRLSLLVVCVDIW